MRAIDFFDHGARKSPHAICLRDAERVFTYSEISALTHRIANGLRAAGVERGARVAIYSINDVLAFAAMLGILRAGAVWLPVTVRNPLAENIEFMRENECELLFVHSAVAEHVPAIAAGVPLLRQIVQVDGAAEGRSDLWSWAAGHAAHFPDDDHGGADLAWIKSTGGTTGRPKSVLTCHRNVEAIIATFHTCMPLAHHVNLMVVPMTHGAGNVALCTLAEGGTVVVFARADPVAILDAIDKYRATTLFLPPTVIYAMLSVPDVRARDYSSLRYFLYSAAPMSTQKLREAFDVFGPVMAQCWGQTESPLICTYLAPQEHFENGKLKESRLTSCGRETLLTRVEVMDDEGKLMAVGQSGELVVRSSLVTLGYHDRPEENEVISRFGWHHTGDIGYRDEEGFLYIVDRKKDMIISGGFNIYPSEVEQALWRHSAILDCAVIGVPDDKWGEAVKAVVELKPGHAATEQELKDHCRDIIGGMKTPKSIEIWPDLPRSSVGKVLKRKIREQYWQGRARRI